MIAPAPPRMRFTALRDPSRIFLSQRRAKANSIERMASPAGITMKAGPGSTSMATPTSTTVPPITPTAMRRVLYDKDLEFPRSVGTPPAFPSAAMHSRGQGMPTLSGADGPLLGGAGEDRYYSTRLRQLMRIDLDEGSARALWLAGLNAVLNEAGGISLRTGSLFEPIAGERFDLITTNPPFVISPPGGDVLTYRDSGLPGDSVVEHIVRQAPGHLTEGGWCQVLANWAILRDQPWDGRLAGWLGDETSAFVVQREVLDPAAYVELWLKDAGLHGAPDYRARYDAWLGWLEAQQVEGVGFGWINLRNAPGPQTFLDHPYAVEQPIAPAVAAWGEAATLLRTLGDEALLSMHPVVAADVRQETDGRPGATDPEAIVLRQQRGVRLARQADTLLTGFVGAADGDLSTDQLLGALATLLDRDVEQVRDVAIGVLAARLEELQRALETVACLVMEAERAQVVARAVEQASGGDGAGGQVLGVGQGRQGVRQQAARLGLDVAGHAALREARLGDAQRALRPLRALGLGDALACHELHQAVDRERVALELHQRVAPQRRHARVEGQRIGERRREPLGDAGTRVAQQLERQLVGRQERTQAHQVGRRGPLRLDLAERDLPGGAEGLRVVGQLRAREQHAALLAQQREIVPQRATGRLHVRRRGAAELRTVGAEAQHHGCVHGIRHAVFAEQPRTAGAESRPAFGPQLLDARDVGVTRRVGRRAAAGGACIHGPL